MKSVADAKQIVCLLDDKDKGLQIENKLKDVIVTQITIFLSIFFFVLLFQEQRRTPSTGNL